MGNSKFARVLGAALVAGLAACLALALPAGAAKKSAFVTKKKTFSSGSLSLTAPDPNSPTSDTDSQPVRAFLGVGKIPDRARIKDVNVSVRITADSDRDVEAYLASPRGLIELTSDNGGTDNDFGGGVADCTGTPTVFDSQAPSSVLTGIAPYLGSFQPEEPLTNLNGLRGVKAKARWTLVVLDDDPAGAVTLNCWKLHLRYRFRR
jgi:subtilisin-like proprotein convertase family protein